MVKLTRPPAKIAGAPALLRAAPKVADPFYLSADWRALVARLKRERGLRCEHPGHEGERRGDRLVGDHIKERRDGGADLDPANVMLVCMICHARKTASAARARRTSVG